MFSGIVSVSNFLVKTWSSSLHVLDISHNWKVFLLFLVIWMLMSTFLFKFHISRFCGSTILNVWFSSKFDFRKLSTVLIGCFLMELTFFSQISPYFFSETWLIIESALSKRNIFRQSWSKDFGTLQWYTTGSILEFDILNWNLISSKEFRNASCLMSCQTT